MRTKIVLLKGWTSNNVYLDLEQAIKDSMLDDTRILAFVDNYRLYA